MDDSAGLQCMIIKEGRDDYTEELTYHFEWELNDSSVSDEYINQVVYEGDSIDISHVQNGEWTCTVRSNDGMQYSQSISTSLEYEDQTKQYEVSLIKDGHMKMIRIPAGENVHGTYTLTKDFI